ncbi:3-isopropylmalate dehydrogenase [Burkholderia singularis]|uniref:3-isopropylmalate dehydrogenase n=1 Tax=Burkholderia singularis TaxID=1503053 RepID=A0A124P9J2_9BURK|nr:3-isopropylmalate dehydrogenase [Burkholderia singularis]SMG02269.1 hypothetical protein BSIN_0889 [Burkholderia singularis]
MAPISPISPVLTLHGKQARAGARAIAVVAGKIIITKTITKT